MDSREATGTTNTKILLNGGSKGFKKWNGNIWEQIPLAESSKDINMEEEDREVDDEGLPMKILNFMGFPKSYRKSLYQEFVPDVTQIPTETASSFNNIVNWIYGDGENATGKVPKTASSAGEGDVGEHVERLQIVSTSSSESVGSQKHIRILRTDSASNMNIVTPFGILVNDEEKQPGPEQPLQFQVVEAMEVQLPSNMIKIAPSLHGLKFEEVPHDKGDIKDTEALFHKTILEQEQPSEKGDINNSNAIFRQPSKINCSEEGDTKVSKAPFRKPSKHVCLSETSIYCYQKSDTEEEVESGQVLKAKLNKDMDNNNNQNPSDRGQSRHVCTSETSIYCYGVSESENEGEFTNSLVNEDEQGSNEAEEVKRVTFASQSETNIYAYQDYEEEEDDEREEEVTEEHCQQTEVYDDKQSEEAKEEDSSENMTKECKENHHIEGQMRGSGKESGTEEEESCQEEGPNNSERLPRKSHKIRERKIQNEVLEQIKQILEENNKIIEKKIFNNALVQAKDDPHEIPDNQEDKVFNDALVQTKDTVPDCHPLKEQNVLSALPRPNPVSIMKNSRGNNPSKTSIQFSLPHQEFSLSSHDILKQVKEIPSETCSINEQTNCNVGLVHTDVTPLESFQEFPCQTSIQTNTKDAGKPIESHQIDKQEMYVEQIPKIQAQKMNEISGESKLYNLEALEQAKEPRGFTPPQAMVEERTKEEATKNSNSGCSVKNTASVVDTGNTPSNTTSEVQMQLNNDLKTLENIVKKLYKSLNKKGPLTLVANFKPKQDGELALDMGSLTGKQKKEVSFSGAFSRDGSSSDKLKKKSSKLKLEEKSYSSTEEVTKERVKRDGGRNLSEKNSITVTQVDNAKGSLNLTKQKPGPHSTAIPRQIPVSIMKSSHVLNSSKSSHHRTNSQVSVSSNSQLPSVTISLKNDSSSCSMRSDSSKANVDINNNIVETPPPSPKPAIKKVPSKMPILRPASSSHSMLKTCIEADDAPSSVSKNENEVVSTPTRPRTSRSKHYILQAAVSDHDTMEHSKNPPNTYKLVEGSNSKHYLVPVISQQEQPKQVIVKASKSRSNTNARSQSQHVLISASRRNQSQHILAEPSPSKSILRSSSGRNSRQLGDSISPSRSHSQHDMMESRHYSKYTFEEPSRSKAVRHVFVQPPPTCQNPHLHPRTATILPPPPSQPSHIRTCTAPSFPSMYGGYRIIQPCSMHQDHPPPRPHNRREQGYSTAEETASNTSMVSSISTRTGNNLSAASEAEEREHFHVPNTSSKCRPSCHNWQHPRQESRSSISPSVRVHVQNPAQSPSKMLTSSPSSTKQQYRTTIRLPPGPSKHNYRELEDIPSAPSDAETAAEDHAELRNLTSRSRTSVRNWQEQNQQGRPPAPSNSPDVRVPVRNAGQSPTNIMTPSTSATKQQYQTTIRIPSKHSKLGSSGVEDNLSATSDTDNTIQERVDLRNAPSRSRASCHDWEQQKQQSRPHASSISPSVKMQARNVPRSTSKTPSTCSTKEQYRTTIHIPSGPPKPSSYSAIFKEKQQKQKQTVYVDLTSNRNRRSNR